MQSFVICKFFFVSIIETFWVAIAARKSRSRPGKTPILLSSKNIFSFEIFDKFWSKVLPFLLPKSQSSLKITFNAKQSDSSNILQKFILFLLTKTVNVSVLFNVFFHVPQVIFVSDCLHVMDFPKALYIYTAPSEVKYSNL